MKGGMGEREKEEKKRERKAGGVFLQVRPSGRIIQIEQTIGCKTVAQEFRVYPASTWLASRGVVAHVGTVQVTLASRGSPLPRLCKSNNVRLFLVHSVPPKLSHTFFPCPFPLTLLDSWGWHLTALHLSAPSIAPFRGSAGRSQPADLSPSGNCKFSLPGPIS